MGVTKRAVVIFQVPTQLTSSVEADLLLRLQQSATKAEHARFVLDCSGMKKVGHEELRFLLCCLEEVMKFNGDLRLAQLEPAAKAGLIKAGIAHMFETFSTTESAVASYQVRPTSLAPLSYAAEAFKADNELAA